jgi:electron transfer flavoprotein alpha subunit
MPETLLVLCHVEDGTLAKAALEALGAAIEVSASLGAPLTLGLVGSGARRAADRVAACGAARTLVADGDAFAQARYATDAAAAEAIARAAGATIVIAPHTSRWARALPGAAYRLGGRIDTHVVSIQYVGPDFSPANLRVTRWYYRQRIEAEQSRAARPWVILIDPGCHAMWSGAAGSASVEPVAVDLPAERVRTQVTGLESPAADADTIRPDADLLFVAGAGWTKKQADGQTHVPEAEQLILGFLARTKASLGGSKSLVDLSGEGQAVLRCMTHLNQVGQTGSTPRHPKGLSACCHGEEPHVVGWRFVTERRAINLDPNCGWARGKADVVYIADAFAVMKRVNELLEETGVRR